MVDISAQSILVVAAGVVLILALWLLFERSIYGKALRATAMNRVGARLVGIPTVLTGHLSFLLAAFIGTVSGILIAPITTLYYDTGFIIGLKGFVGAILGGGMASYPLAALAAAPFVLPEFYVTLMNYIGLATLVTLGLVLLTGVAGLLSFGQQAFVGIGAYMTGVLTTLYSGSPWLGLAAGLAATALVALGLGLITARLSGHYLPISTIAWGISVYFVFGNLDVLGRYNGLGGIPPLAILGWTVNTGRESYAVIWLFTFAALLAARNLLDSRSGRALRALRFRGTMAESFGIDTARMKLIIFVYAALLAALSGWLYAHFLRFVSPGAFNVNAGIDYLFMAVVGGASQV